MPMRCDVSSAKCEMRSAKCEMQNVKCDASLCPSPTILLSFLPLFQRLGSPPFDPVSVSARKSFYFSSSVNALPLGSAPPSARLIRWRSECYLLAYDDNDDGGDDGDDGG
ncbi:hypothetical protein MMC31_003975 [Peltigera leucophlebia]|nr:hypothetical protein [Peltigera leucophlebia]